MGFLEQEQQYQNEEVAFASRPQIAKDPELIKWQLSGADLVDEIKHRLLGQVYDEVNNRWIDQAKPELNDDGINFVISALIQIINKNTILSTLDEEMVYKIMIELDDELSNDFAVHYQDYDIKIVKLTFVKNSVCNQCFFALSRAIDGGEKKYLQSTEHRQYSFNQPLPQNNKPRTFFGIPLPGGANK